MTDAMSTETLAQIQHTIRVNFENRRFTLSEIVSRFMSLKFCDKNECEKLVNYNYI